MISRDRRIWVGRFGYNVVLLVALLVVLLGVLPITSIASGAPSPLTPTGCDFVLGFAALRDLINKAEGADRVGACLENEYHAPNGDGVQWTTSGLMIWRKASNWIGFTDGQHTWVNGPFGLQKRLNTEQFPWEIAKDQDVVAFLSNPSGALSQPIEVDEAVRQVLVLHLANDGSTFNMFFGNLAGKKLYAVSLYPERGIVVKGRQIALEVLQRFILDNRDLLQDPRVSVGTWFNSENNMTYLDVSATIPDKQQAIELGRRYNQIAIFDLASFEEIRTGGTGEKIENLPPADKRLPELRLDQR